MPSRIGPTEYSAASLAPAMYRGVRGPETFETTRLIGGRYGLQTMCEGGGQANVTIIERLG